MSPPADANGHGAPKCKRIGLANDLTVFKRTVKICLTIVGQYVSSLLQYIEKLVRGMGRLPNR